MTEVSEVTNRVKTSAKRCVDTLCDLITFRHKIVTDLRETSRKVDRMATGSRAGKIAGVGLVCLAPFTFGISAAAGAGLILGASVLDKVFSKEYKKEMTIKLQEDKKRLYALNDQLHDFNRNLQAFTSLKGIPDDVRKFVIETSRLAGLHDPEDFERRIESLVDLGNRIIALFVDVYKGDSGMLADEMRSIANTVDRHFPDLNKLEDGLRKISQAV